MMMMMARDESVILAAAFSICCTRVKRGQTVRFRWSVEDYEEVAAAVMAVATTQRQPEQLLLQQPLPVHWHFTATTTMIQ